MKGIVFSELIEMVEEVFSPEVADQIIHQADLPSGGAYTAVGTYDHAEILELVSQLSQVTGMPVADLVKAFGRHLAARFTQLYPGFFEGVSGTLAFLQTIEGHVHVEVHKLYPDAELPSFTVEPGDGQRMTMVYRSRRPFADLAEGLIGGAAAHFGERLDIDRVDGRDGDFHVATFNLAIAS